MVALRCPPYHSQKDWVIFFSLTWQHVQHPFWTTSAVSASPFSEELFMSDADTVKNHHSDSLYAHLPSIQYHQGLNIWRHLTVSDITRFKSVFEDPRPWLDDCRGLQGTTIQASTGQGWLRAGHPKSKSRTVTQRFTSVSLSLRTAGGDLWPSRVMNTTPIELQTGLTASSFRLAWQRPYSKSWARNLHILVRWSFIWWQVLIILLCTVNRNTCATCNPSILWVIIDHSSYSSEMNSMDVSGLFLPMASQFEEGRAEALYGQTSLRWNDVSDTELGGLFAANGDFIFSRIRLTGHVLATHADRRSRTLLSFSISTSVSMTARYFTPSTTRLQQGCGHWLISSSITYTGTQILHDGNHQTIVTKSQRCTDWRLFLMPVSWFLNMVVFSFSSTYITYHWTGYLPSGVDTTRSRSCSRLLRVTSYGPWSGLESWWRRNFGGLPLVRVCSFCLNNPSF